MKYKVNMRSFANKVKGQGVGSAYEEQVSLIREMDDKYEVTVNKHHAADITHYHTVNPNYFLSIPFAKHHGATVGYVHFLPETVEQSLQMPRFCKKVFYKYILSFYKSMDSLVTVNPYFIDRLEAYGVDRSRVTYIPNFVSEKEFYPLPLEEKRQLREKYKLSPDRFTVVCAGQLQTRKGIFDFIETARRLPEIQFVWAGGFSFGKMTDGYEEIKKAVEHPLPNILFTGIVDRSEMNNIYNLGDVMFLPSFEELFPMTVLEAMNCHIPLLLRDLPIYENILFDYYQKDIDVDGFVKTITRLADDAEYYRKAGEDSWRGHLFYNREHVRQMWDEYYSARIAEFEMKKAMKKAHTKKSKSKRGAAHEI